MNLKRGKPSLQQNVFVRAITACSTLIISGYLYLYCNNPSAHTISLVLFCLAGVVVLWSLVPFSKGFCGRRKKDGDEAIPHEESAAFSRLAKEMQVSLQDKRPFRKVKHLSNIGTQTWSLKPFSLKPYIIIGEDLYDRLNRDERLSVIAHEFAHLKMHHHGIRSISVLVPFFLILWTAPLGIVRAIMGITAALLGLWAASYLCEYSADRVAIRYVKDKASFISALKKTEPPDRWNVDYETHPSVNRRIARLSKE